MYVYTYIYIYIYIERERDIHMYMYGSCSAGPVRPQEDAEAGLLVGPYYCMTIVTRLSLHEYCDIISIILLV